MDPNAKHKSKLIKYKRHACSLSGRRLIIKVNPDNIIEEIENSLPNGVAFTLKHVKVTQSKKKIEVSTSSNSEKNLLEKVEDVVDLEPMIPNIKTICKSQSEQVFKINRLTLGLEEVTGSN